MKLPYTCKDCGAVVANYLPCDCKKPRAIEILCKEIGIHFDRRMETFAMLRAFVSVLVSEISGEREVQSRITHLTGKPPTAESHEVLQRVYLLLGTTEPAAMVSRCAEVHDYINSVHSDEAYPTDHTIDMLSSCVSALRFGLEMPCNSRHAASAGQHVWKQKYGVRLFDSFTPEWEKSWMRQKFLEAMLLQIPTS